MPVSRKKVIVRKLSRDWLSGYLPPSAFVAHEQVQVLDLAGKLVSVHMSGSEMDLLRARLSVRRCQPT